MQRCRCADEGYVFLDVDDTIIQVHGYQKFIDEHRDVFGVEPICRVLSQHGATIAPSTYYEARNWPPSKPALRA